MPSPLLRFNRPNGAAFRVFACAIACGLCGGLAAAQNATESQATESQATESQAAEREDLARPQLTFVGAFRLPTGLSYGVWEDAVPFGGISAIDRDPASNTFYALSDDRAEYGPARLYRIGFDVDASVTDYPTNRFSFVVDSVIELTRDGAPYAAKSLDPEAMRLTPDGAGFYWAHERNENGVPFVGAMNRNGETTRSFALPSYYLPTADAGIRVNLAFESLTIDLEGRVVVATENALRQDGPEADGDHASPARVLIIDPETGAPVAEYIYLVDPVAAAPIPAGGFHTNGLVELLALPNGDFLAMERSFSVGQGNMIKLYVTDFDGADDVLGQPSILNAEAPIAPMRKRLIYTIQAGGVVDAVDNLEAMSFGRPLSDGAEPVQTLVLMSDNNFNPGQFTQILMFQLK